MRSPVESSMSSSRGWGCGETWRASSSSASVVFPIAEIVPTTRDAALVRLDEAARDVPDLVRVGDGRAAELHDDGLGGLLGRGVHERIVASGRGEC